MTVIKLILAWVSLAALMVGLIVLALAPIILEPDDKSRPRRPQ